MKSDRGRTTYKPQNLKKMWDYVLANHKDWDGSTCKVVYLTHRNMKKDVSLFINGKDMDEISEFVETHLAPLECVKAIKMLGLMKPRFFPIPKGTFEGLERYTVAIMCESRFLKETYRTLSRYMATESVVPNYLAYTLAGEESDLYASYSCKGESTLRRFIDRYVRPLEGVTEVRVTRISKTKRLVSVEEWRELFEEFVTEEGIEVEDTEGYEEDWISGC
jgi:hypothetical protein